MPVFEEFPPDGGGYVAYIVDLPGAISEGDTLGRGSGKSQRRFLP